MRLNLYLLEYPVCDGVSLGFFGSSFLSLSGFESIIRGRHTTYYERTFYKHYMSFSIELPKYFIPKNHQRLFLVTRLSTGS
jgi:hypothetical protein